MHEFEASCDEPEGASRSRGANEEASSHLRDRLRCVIKRVPCSSTFRLQQSRNKACAVWLVALELSSRLPTVEAVSLFGMEVGAGIATIFGVILFLFIVPCITKLVHIIRKSALPSNHTPRVYTVQRPHYISMSVLLCSHLLYGADMQVNKLRNADLFGGGDQEYADEDEDDDL